MVSLLVYKRLIYKILYFETRLLKYLTVNLNDLNVIIYIQASQLSLNQSLWILPVRPPAQALKSRLRK